MNSHPILTCSALSSSKSAWFSRMRAAKDHAEVDKEEKRTLLEGGVEVRETEKMTMLKSLTLPRTG